MRVEEELSVLSPEKDMLLTIGVFDGVHLGHKYLISQLTGYARQQNLLSGLITFRQHPREVLSSQAKLLYLTNLDEKVRLLKNEGVDVVLVLSFTQELAQLSAGQFIGLLKKHLRMRGLLVGSDFVMGRNREGNAEALLGLGQEMNFTLTVIPPMKVSGEVVSSTAIRNALTDGDMKKVTSLIGRYFSLQGRIISGVGRGSKLGFPTANLEIDPKQALPADGVYVTRLDIDGQAYQSVTNIGWRPTFAGNGRTIETYIIDYQGNLYDRQLKIEIIERLRAEKQFDTVEELKKQIAEDVKQGKMILNAQSRN